MLLAASHQPSVETVCTPSQSQQQELAAIDTMMQTRPDSALCLLLGKPMDNPYYQLLLSEALYKNDSAQLNRTELLSAVAYYDSVACPFLSARCHYMNGVGYYEMDSVVPACQEYLTALEIMEEHFEENELVGFKAKFMALIFTRLTVVFSDQYLHEQVICLGKCSIPYYHKCNTEPWNTAWMLDKIGTHYDMMEQWDSAGYYYAKAMEVLPDSNSLTYRDVAGIQALLSYKTTKNTDDAIGRLVKLCTLSDSEMERLSRYAVIGEIYYNEGSYDSARRYLEPVFQKSASLASRKQCAEYLAEICKVQGDSLELMECIIFLAPFGNQNENSSTLRSQLTVLFDKYWDNRSERSHQRIIAKRIYLTLFLFGCLLATIVLILIIHKKSNYEHRLQQAALAGRLKRSNKALLMSTEAIKRQERELESKNKTEVVNYSFKERYDMYLQAEICQEIKTLAARLNSNKMQPLKTNVDVSEYKPFALTNVQKTKLLKAFDRSFPGLLESLKTIYPSFDRKGELFCTLHMLEIDRMSMCVLLQEPYHTCRRIALRLEKGFDCPNHLFDFLIERAQVC